MQSLLTSVGSELLAGDAKTWLAVAGVGLGIKAAINAMHGLQWITSPSHPRLGTTALKPEDSPALKARYFQSPTSKLWLAKRMWRVKDQKGLVRDAAPHPPISSG